MKFLQLFIFLVAPAFMFGQQNEVCPSKPDPGNKAVVYFYSLATTTTIGRVKKPVFLDDREIAEIRPEHYFIVLVEPGKHSFSLRNKKFGGIEMEFEAGKTYFLRIDWETNVKLTPKGISKVEPESGAYDVRQMQPVGTKNIKNKEIVFLKLDD